MSNLKNFGKLISRAKALSKSTLSVVLALCLLVMMIPTVLLVAADAWDGKKIDDSFAGGTGSEADPYQIASGDQLAYLAKTVNEGTNYSGLYLKLTDDIDLNNQEWTRIGDTKDHAFKGTFDGDGHTISNLYVTGSAGYAGLFGYAAATIKNLTLEGNVNVTKAVAAAFVAYATGNVTFDNCVFSGDISVEASADSASTGVFVGGNWNCGTITIQNCAAVNTTVTVTKGTLSYAPQSTGGFVGTAASGTDVVITDSYFSGTVNGGNGTGGLVGTVFYGNGSTNPSTVTIKRSYTEGTIAGQGVTGGLVGYTRLNGNTTKPIIVDIEDCYSTATVSSNSTSHNVCGLVGSNYAAADDMSTVTIKIQNSFFAGSAKYPIYFKTGTIDLNAASTFSNVYYKAGSATNTSDLTPAITCEKDAPAFTNSTVKDLLNGGRTVWIQGETHPIFAKSPKMTNLEIDNGQLSFDAAVTDYNVSLNNSVTSLLVTPTVEDGTNVTINDAPATSGTAYPVALTANDTTIINVKIERDGNDKTYVITVTCAHIWDGTTVTPYPNVDEANAGTKENPYKIGLPEHLAYMAQQINAGNGKTAYYELVADIELANELWTPIGNTSKTFSGTLDGNGYSINGLNYYYDVVTDADGDGNPDEIDTYYATSPSGRASSGAGLFGAVSGATIKDLNVKGSVETDQYTTGGLIGAAAGSVTIRNCHFTGTVKGGATTSYTSYTGGFIGAANTQDATITILDSSFTGTVRGDNTEFYTYTSAADQTLKLKTASPEYTGGFIGYLTRATVYVADSYVNADVIGEGATAIGGIIGGIQYNGSGGFTTATIERCYTTGSVTGTRIGGLVGWLRDNSATADGKGVQLTLRNCYSTAKIVSSNTAASGLVSGTRDSGSAQDVILQMDNCFFAGTANCPTAFHAVSSGSQWDIDVTTEGYTPLSYHRNLYYAAGTYSNVTNDITNGMTGAEKSADDMKSQAFVDLLNANAGETVWGLGTDHPVLLAVPKLDNIKLSKGSIAFNPITFEYQAYVPNAYDEITVTPTSADPEITIKVNGNGVLSGQASAPIALVDNGTVDVEVLVMRGNNTSTYTIHVTGMDGWNGAAIPFPNINEENAGTAENPYQIALPEHLAFLQKLAKEGTYQKGTTANGAVTANSTTTVVVDDETYVVSYPPTALGTLYGAYFEIVSDISLNDQPWTTFDFRGHLDGGNHTISGLKATSGLFASLTYGSVSNLNVVGTVSGSGNVGGLVGSLQGGAKLTNCSFAGNVSGTTNVGGLVGRTNPYSGGQNFYITACWTSGTVTGTGAGIGGLVGNSLYSAQYGGTVHLKDCYSTMKVETTAADTVDNMAGLVGTGDVTYRNCFFAGQIASAYPIGFSKTYTIGSVYYEDVSCTDVTSENAGFVGGTKKSAADLNSDALVAVLNTYAAPGVVWTKGADHPVFTYTNPGDVTASDDPFLMTALAVEHAAFTFTPAQFTYSLSLPYSASEIHMLPTAPAGTTVTVDGEVVKAEEISQAIALEVGVEKTVIVKVALGDSYTNYEVTLLRREQPAEGVWDGALEAIDTTKNKGSAIDDPILINTPGQLAFLAAMTNGQDVMLNGKVYKAPTTSAGKLYNGVYFEITADLIMNDVTDYENWENAAPANDFTPIGFHSDTATESRTFAGIVNGNSHKIIGLYVSGKNSTGMGGTGLFGSVENGTLRNIHVEQSYVKGGQRVGGLVGRPRTWITVQNCSFSGTVVGTSVYLTVESSSTQVGGLFGDCVAKAFINSCWTEGTVKGGRSIGGLIGQAYIQTGLEMKNCYSVMSVEPAEDPNSDTGYASNAGGLIGIISGNAGTVEIYRSHFAGSIPNNTPFVGGKNASSTGVTVSASDTVYYSAGSYVGEVNSTYTYDAIEKSVEEFADGTVTDLLNNLVEYGDLWNWETSENGYPVSDGELLITDFRDHTSDEYYDDGEWWINFTNKPGGTLKEVSSNKGDSNLDDGEYGDSDDNYDDDNYYDDDDYTNTDTGEKSIFSAVLILALISAFAAILLVRRKRSVN